ncbi:MAG TPA: glycosyltransferase family 2 protein [Oculatellaceae cyanobacterium]
MPTLSLVIVAQNEERTVGKVLDAAKPLCDEIILVDSGSSDKTKDIAASYGAKVVHQDWLGYGPQKNFAMGLATCDWILSLDADEILTPQLVAEIKDALADRGASEYDGFKIPRLLFIGEKPVWHGGFYPDAQLRLIKRGAGLFNNRLVHEAIKVSGPTKTLTHYMQHYSYVNVEQFEAAMEKYARLHAQEFVRRTDKKKDVSRLNETIHPIWTFLYRYVVRGGFLDGELGLQLNLCYSSYVARKIRYLRELQADCPPK